MSKKLKFIWIDDLPDREGESVNLARAIKATPQFISVKKKDLNEVLTTVLNLNEPDLLIIDHKLEDETTGIFKTGSTMVELVREKWGTCPIICVTGAGLKEISSRKFFLYDDVFDVDKISDHYETIRSIANSFRTLRTKTPKTIEALFKLLGAPKEDYPKLRTVLPHELRILNSDKDGILNISFWVRNSMLKRPGFLYDSLWVSTLLGIKESSFRKVEKLFIKAKYNGIFADDSNPKWWKTSVLNILSEAVQTTGLPWEKGRKLPGINSRNYSKCFASGRDKPETVAFIDETEDSERAAMSLRETIPHPNYVDLLFFEEMRMMRPAQ